MLLKDTQEIQGYFSAIDNDYNFPSLESFIRDAESDIVIPEISRELFDLLQEHYNNNTLDGRLKELHALLQKAIVHLALFLSSDSGSFRISDSGYYVVVTGDMRPVSDKKMVVFRRGRIEAGYKALDQAIAYLEQYVSDPAFDLYRTSEVRAEATNYFIPSSKAFTRCFSPLKNSSTTYRAMLSSIDQAENTYILPLLGEDLFEELKAAVLEGSLSDDQKRLVTRIQKPLALYAVAEAIPMVNFDYDGKSLSVTNLAATGENTETTTSLSTERLSELMNACMMNGQNEGRRLKSFLEKNAALYPNYVPSLSSEGFNFNSQGSGIFFL